MLTAMRSPRICLRKRAFVQALKKDDHREVVLQVLTDRQIDHGLDVHRAKMRRRTDPRNASTNGGVLNAPHARITSWSALDPHHIPAALEVFDAGWRACRASAREVAWRAGRYVEVFPLLRRSEIGGRGPRSDSRPGWCIDRARSLLAACRCNRR